MNDAQPHTGLGNRLIHEIKEYAAVSAYLWVCLGAFQVYKSALLQAEGISYVPYGLAAVKALILGKFMMVGHALRVGRGFSGRPLMFPILHKSLVFLALLFVLNLLEEVIAGMIHGRSLLDSLSEIGGGTLMQTVAVCILFFLILLPYFAYREIAEVLGEGRLRRMLFTGTGG